MSGPVNRQQGEYAATLAGERFRFNTELGTIATVEDLCGQISIVEILGRVVTGRRAADQIALLTASLQAAGVANAAEIAARTRVGEAEAFVLAFMGALGFRLAPDATGDDRNGGERPLDRTSAGADGAPSLSAA